MTVGSCEPISQFSGKVSKSSGVILNRQLPLIVTSTYSTSRSTQLVYCPLTLTPPICNLLWKSSVNISHFCIKCCSIELSVHVCSVPLPTIVPSILLTLAAHSGVSNHLPNLHYVISFSYQ